MKTILILLLITTTLQIKKEMSKKIKKSQKTKVTYSNTVTIDSVTFTDNCYALSEGYTFTLDITQTSSNYPISLKDVIYLESVDNSADDISCTCTGNAGTNTLECV